MALTPLWFQSYFCTVILIFKKLHLILLSKMEVQAENGDKKLLTYTFSDIRQPTGRTFVYSICNGHIARHIESLMRLQVSSLRLCSRSEHYSFSNFIANFLSAIADTAFKKRSPPLKSVLSMTDTLLFY